MQHPTSNREWTEAIFKLLLVEPDLHDKYSFRPEYFMCESTDEVLKTLATMYSPMRSLMTKDSMQWSLKTFEIAFYTKAKPEYYSLFTAETSGELIDPEQKQTLAHVRTVLSSIFDSIDAAYGSLSRDFIIDNLDRLSRFGYLYCSELEKFTSLRMVMSDAMDVDDAIYRIKSEYDRIDEKYSYPGVASANYSSPFDKSLRVKITNIVYPTAMAPLNRILNGGFRSQTLSGFLTKTGGGKSTFLLTLAADALRLGQNVFYLNMEMNAYEVNDVILASITGRPVDEIEMNLTDDEYMDNLEKEYNAVVRSHFYQTARNGLDGAITIKTLRSAVKRAEKEIAVRTSQDEFHFDLVIIDYLYLMQPVMSMGRNSRSDEKYKQLVREAHDFAVNDKYAVITVFQSNRGAEQKIRAGKQIFADDLAESYGGLSDMDNMFMLISHWTDEETFEEGALITDIKLRKRVLPEKVHFFMPYDTVRCVYDSALSREIEFEEPEEDPEEEKIPKKRGRKPMKKEIDVSFVLRHCDESILEIPLGVIQNDMKRFGVSNTSETNKIKSIISERGKKFKTVKDYSDIDIDKAFNKWREMISEAVSKARDIKASGLADIENVRISGDSLFM